MTSILQYIDVILWGGFLNFFLLGLGIYLTYQLKGLQFKYLFYSLKLAFSKHDNKAKGDISQFQSLMTALAATIGICSIAGMATAIVGGGYGAIFWMWIVAFLGMATKYSEAILAVKFRTVNEKKQMAGGPMYYLQNGMKSKKWAIIFSVFGAMAALGGGNLIQSQSITDAVKEIVPISSLYMGIILAALAACVLVGGIKFLGKVNAFLVPFMALFYVFGGLVIIIINIEQIPQVFAKIFQQAFSLSSITWGTVGGFFTIMQMGIARGISSNEAGMGSSPIAAAAAKTHEPAQQGLISMSGVFLSSFVVCMITILVLGVTNIVGTTNAQGELLNGAALVMHAFDLHIPYGKYIVAIGLVLFGFSTILGWSYCGEKCMEYLFSGKMIRVYRIIFVFIVFIGAFLHIDMAWALADIFNGLMTFPNLVGIYFLSHVVKEETQKYFRKGDIVKELV